jgi:hypothetical protein
MTEETRLDAILTRLRPAEPSELDLHRLRRRVAAGRTAADLHHAGRKRAIARSGLTAAAAAIVLGVLGLSASTSESMLAGRPGSPRFGRGEAGEVAIDFAGKSGPHRIFRSEDPSFDRDVLVTITHGQTFVDTDEQAAPGSVTFYRID